MSDFYTDLVGKKVRSNRGNVRRICAVWLGPNNNITTLVADIVDGEMFLLNLPDPDWDIVNCGLL